MTSPHTPTPFFPTALRRGLVTLAGAGLVMLVMTHGWQSGLVALLPRVLGPALAALLLYSFFERWPRRLPSRLPRWVLQVAAATLIVPATVLAIYLSSVQDGEVPFWDRPERMNGFLLLSVMGMFVASWTAMGALMRQRDAAVRTAHERELALQRQVADARLRLLQAQVQPHFLFNTLANVQALVDARSPQASEVLSSLVAYLRAAVPRLSDPVHTLGQEVEAARAYLALMRLRMPDRLQVSVEIDPGLAVTRCPPMTVMTLVENAIRHGIDPSLEGGRIDVHARRVAGDRAVVSVRDTGLGFNTQSSGLGTGLSSLRERLLSAFGPTAALRLTEVESGGVLAEIEFPLES